MLKKALHIFFMLIAIQQLHAQKEISYRTDNVCNDSARIARSTVIITGKTQCLMDIGHDQVILFTTLEEFDTYIAKNMSHHGLCATKEPMKFDLSKFDVALVRIGTKACDMPEDTFSSLIKDGKLEIYIYMNVKSPGCEDLQIFSSYYLIPKGYPEPVFHFCTTGNK